MRADGARKDWHADGGLTDDIEASKQQRHKLGSRYLLLQGWVCKAGVHCLPAHGRYSRRRHPRPSLLRSIRVGVWMLHAYGGLYRQGAGLASDEPAGCRGVPEAVARPCAGASPCPGQEKPGLLAGMTQNHALWAPQVFRSPRPSRARGGISFPVRRRPSAAGFGACWPFPWRM
jgi:hypothetical protein